MGAVRGKDKRINSVVVTTATTHTFSSPRHLKGIDRLKIIFFALNLILWIAMRRSIGRLNVFVCKYALSIDI